jgi:hypothetical protein
MTTASEKMILAIQYVVKQMGIGTNLNLFNILWAMVSGGFLMSRGTVHLALKISGCTDGEISRASTCLRTGQWQIGELITSWRQYVHQETGWKRRTYAGWHAVSADVVVFPRPKLEGWRGKLYRGVFGKAVKAVGLGMIVDIGEYQGQRVPLLRRIVRSRNCDHSEKLMKQDLLKTAAKLLKSNELLIHDAGAKIKDMRKAGVTNYVIRLSKNCVARRKYLPANAHGNRQYGEEIRPLARMRKGKKIEATEDADFKVSFQWQGREIKARCWRSVVGYEDKVFDRAQPYDIWVFLTPGLKNHGWWERRSTYWLRSSFISILIAGLWNKHRWRLSSELDYKDNMSGNLNAVGVCLS